MSVFYPGSGVYPLASLFPRGLFPTTLPVTQFAAEAYALAAPIAAGDDQRGYPLAILCGAVGEMFRDVEDLVRARPGRDPWQQAFDINAAPTWLYPWLGQLVGVRDLDGLIPADQKTKIIAEQGIYRGGVAQLQSKVAATLTGGRAVSVIERTSDADHLTIVVDPTQVVSLADTTNAANAAKVLGLLLTIVQTSVPIIDQGGRTIDAGTSTIDGAALSDIN